MAALLRPAAIPGGFCLCPPHAPELLAGWLGSSPRSALPHGEEGVRGKQLEGLQGQAGSGPAHPARSDACKEKAVPAEERRDPSERVPRVQKRD